MSRSYPIWNEVTACIYSSSKSYGAKNESNAKVLVGTSGSNSELLVRHRTTRTESGDYTIFKFMYNCGKGWKTVSTKYMNTKKKTWLKGKPKALK